MKKYRLLSFPPLLVIWLTVSFASLRIFPEPDTMRPDHGGLVILLVPARSTVNKAAKRTFQFYPSRTICMRIMGNSIRSSFNENAGAHLTFSS